MASNGDYNALAQHENIILFLFFTTPGTFGNYIDIQRGIGK